MKKNKKMIILVTLFLGVFTFSKFIPKKESGLQEKLIIDSENIFEKQENKSIKKSKNKVQKTFKTKKWTVDKFINFAQKTIETMPTKATLSSLSAKEVHHTPEVIIKSGRRLGTLKAQLKLNSEFIPEAIRFYEECSTLESSPTPIRAICLANLVYLKEKDGELVDGSIYPKKVVDLADKAGKLPF